MLAQNFKSAADLGITEPQFDALRKTLVLLETGKLTHVPEDELKCDDSRNTSFTGHFNMAFVTLQCDCGTVACIKGTAELISGERFSHRGNDGLQELFFTPHMNNRDISTSQAATALRSYLTTGDARWDLAVS